MKYAPVLITTLCRYDSFVRCIESLRKCTWAEYTDVYVSLDYPTKESHFEGYRKIKEYCEQNIQGFSSFNLVIQKHNLGAIGNFEHSLDMMFKKYDCCIYSFDDLEHSHNFIQYMDTMLEKYDNDRDVIEVAGYSYPVDWEVSKECSAIKENFVASIWGGAFWKDKYYEMKNKLKTGYLVKQFSNAYKDGRFNKLTDWAKKDYVQGICYGVSPHAFVKRVTDIGMRIYLAIDNKYVIMPTESKVRYWGFDGSGEFCEKIEYDDQCKVYSGNYCYQKQKIDENTEYITSVDVNCDIEKNFQLMNEFDYVDSATMERVLERVKYYASLNFFEKKTIDAKMYANKILDILKVI